MCGVCHRRLGRAKIVAGGRFFALFQGDDREDLYWTAPVLGLTPVRVSYVISSQARKGTIRETSVEVTKKQNESDRWPVGATTGNGLGDREASIFQRSLGTQ